jgi:hypothetical protein
MGFEDAAAMGERRNIVYGVGGNLVAIYVVVNMYVCIIGYLNTYFVQRFAWFEPL